MEAGSLERGGSRDAVVTPREEAEVEDHVAVGGAEVEADQPHSDAGPQAAAADSPRRRSGTMLHALTERVSPRLESEQSFMHPTGSAPADLASSRSMLRRAQARAEELRVMFHLPPSEHFLDDYMCALKKKVLLQGRMYVFGEHVCFHSSLFGYVKKKCIPLSEVVDVRKKKNVGFPNSIELTLESGKREFFTSFLAREEAYKLIMAQWRQCSEHAPPTPEPDAGGEGHSMCVSRQVSRLLQGVSLRSMGSLVGSREVTPSQELPDLGPTRSSLPGGLAPLDEHSAVTVGLGRDSCTTEGSGSGSGDRVSLSNDPVPAGAAAAAAAPRPPRGDAPPDLLQDNSVVLPSWASGAVPGAPRGEGSAPAGEGSAPAGEGSVTAGGAQSGSCDCGGGEVAYEFQALTDLQCQKELELEVARSEPAPPVPDAMQHVVEFELPCPPLEFWARFLANHSTFLQEFHAARGDTAIRVSKWQKHFKVGMVRDLQFVHPVKARIGPPQAVCHQTQRLSVFVGRHLVLETSQVMSGIPYADSFSVETRWDVAPAGSGSHVRVSLAVPFTKKTMWRSFIEKGSFDDVQEAVQGWRQKALEVLEADPSLTSLSPAGAEPRSEAEWNALLSRVDPLHRGGARHARRHSRAASLSQQGGVHVGHALPVLARHRRAASRATADGPRAAGQASPQRLHSRSNSSRSLRQAAEAAAEALQAAAASAGGQGRQHSARQHSARQQPTGRTGFLPALAACLLGLLGQLLGLLRAAARALASRQSAGLALCAVVIAVQAAIIVQQRQQLAGLRGPAPASGGGVQHAASAAAALGREVARMQEALRLLQTQLDSAASTAAALGSQLQSTAASAGGAPG